jgi:hypothetical protein
MYWPFTLVAGLVGAIKLGTLVYFALAGFGMYLFVRRALGSVIAAGLAGIVYALHPIHIDLSTHWGLTNFAPFYPFVPLLFLAAHELAHKPSARTAVFAAVVATLASWADFERPFVLAPFLAAYFGYELVRARKAAESAGVRRLGPVVRATALALALAVGLYAFVLVPTLIEMSYNAIVSREEVLIANEWGSLNNPVYPVDRLDLSRTAGPGAHPGRGWLSGALAPYLADAPYPMLTNSATYYVGIVPLMAGLAALLFAPRVGLGRGWTVFWLAAMGSAYWIACGVRSVAQTVGGLLYFLFTSPGFAPYKARAGWTLAAGLAAVGVGAFYGLTCLHRPVKSAWLFGLPALAALVLFGRPFVWLRDYVPLYSDMRSPGWFTAVVPSVAAAGLIAAAGLVLERLIPKQRTARLAGGALAFFVLVDFAPYRALFGESYPAQVTRDLETVSRLVAADPEYVRTLSTTSYDPRSDMAIIYTGKPSAWAWLTWSSDRETKSFIFDEIYRKLPNPATLSEALNAAGFAAVKYFYEDTGSRWGRPLAADGSLPLVATSDNFLMFRNPRARPFIQVYGAETPDLLRANPLGLDDGVRVAFERPDADRISINEEAPMRVRVMVAESAYPGWTVQVDGQRASMEAAEGVFLSTLVDAGRHRVVFEYRAPVYFAASRWLSIASLLAAAALALSNPSLGGSVSERQREDHDG